MCFFSQILFLPFYRINIFRGKVSAWTAGSGSPCNGRIISKQIIPSLIGEPKFNRNVNLESRIVIEMVYLNRFGTGFSWIMLCLPHISPPCVFPDSLPPAFCKCHTRKALFINFNFYRPLLFVRTSACAHYFPISGALCKKHRRIKACSLLCQLKPMFPFCRQLVALRIQTGAVRLFSLVLILYLDRGGRL